MVSPGRVTFPFKNGSKGERTLIALKRSKFTESQIVFAQKQAESGKAVAEVRRKLGFSKAIFYNWKKKRGGLDAMQQAGRISKLISIANLRDLNCPKMSALAATIYVRFVLSAKP